METLDAFFELRRKARAKRDAAVRLANKKFSDTLDRINALEGDILGVTHSSRKSMIDCIFEVIPKDKPFTAQGVLTSLIALEPNGDWDKRSIDWHSEEWFLHALNYCMLLPGPEATQLATYIGWLMHRTKGGLLAGILFILSR